MSAADDSSPWYQPARLARLYSATPLMTAFLDADQRVRMASSAWCAWYGIDPAKVEGQAYESVVGAARHARHRLHLELARRGTATVFEDERVDALGTSRWCHVHLAPDVGESGDRGVLLVQFDITAERARDEVIARQREQLHAGLSDRRRSDAVHAELEKTRTLLDWRTAMLTERNEMLHLLSHEIRQPLSNASAALQATTRTVGSLQLAEATPALLALARAETVLAQVIGTLDNTLAAGTILAIGEDPAHLSDNDLPTLIQLVLGDIAADARARIRLEWRTGTRTVRLHPTLMRLTLRNLLNNALAYSPDRGQVLVRITESDEPLALVIDVCDEGTGIPAELRPRLFEKGARGANSRLRPGAGLGLYIVRSVMNIHRGRVDALANSPSGTIMRLTLPQGIGD
ncbi:MAG: PAS domain-containing protein [Xanthomonadales bacterium]|nr:PAS domain-containing protein [Xanthomonadales bacterium]